MQSSGFAIQSGSHEVISAGVASWPNILMFPSGRVSTGGTGSPELGGEKIMLTLPGPPSAGRSTAVR